MKNDKTSLKAVVYDGVLNSVVIGEYKASEIIHEQELIDRFKVSKSPVREALIALCNDEILRNIPRYGYEVIRLTSKEVMQILEYRFILESGILQRNIETVSSEILDALIELDGKCNESVNDMWLHWEYNTKFHLKLCEAAKNEYILKELARSMEVLRRAYGQFYWDKWDGKYNPSDMKNHNKIIECITNKDIENALYHLRMDLDDFRGM